MAALNNVELITALLSCTRQLALASHSSRMRVAGMAKKNGTQEPYDRHRFLSCRQREHSGKHMGYGRYKHEKG
jgi:hypothetical protein